MYKQAIFAWFDGDSWVSRQELENLLQSWEAQLEIVEAIVFGRV